MRRLILGMVVAVATALVPLWALAGNQEVAEQIGANLRSSGQLHGYKIGVKFQDGTVWLRGSVADRAQLDAASKIVSHTPGVKNVINNVTIVRESQEPAGQPQQVTGAMAPEQSKPLMTADVAAGQATAASNRAFTASNPRTGRVEAVATSFTPSPAQPAGVEEPTSGPDMVRQPTGNTLFTGMAQLQSQSRSMMPTAVPKRPLTTRCSRSLWLWFPTRRPLRALCPVLRRRSARHRTARCLEPQGWPPEWADRSRSMPVLQ